MSAVEVVDWLARQAQGEAIGWGWALCSLVQCLREYPLGALAVLSRCAALQERCAMQRCSGASRQCTAACVAGFVVQESRRRSCSARLIDDGTAGRVAIAMACALLRTLSACQR